MMGYFVSISNFAVLNFHLNIFFPMNHPKGVQNRPYKYELDFPVNYKPHQNHVMQCTGHWFKKRKGSLEGPQNGIKLWTV